MKYPVIYGNSENWEPDIHLIEGYREMAADHERGREVDEWCEGLIGDAIPAEAGSR